MAGRQRGGGRAGQQLADRLTLRGNDIAGIAVHTAARVVDFAEPGETLVTSTVRDLVAGSELQFERRAEHVLKGLPGEWQLLAVKAGVAARP